MNTNKVKSNMLVPGTHIIVRGKLSYHNLDYSLQEKPEELKRFKEHNPYNQDSTFYVSLENPEIVKVETTGRDKRTLSAEEVKTAENYITDRVFDATKADSTKVKTIRFYTKSQFAPEALLVGENNTSVLLNKLRQNLRLELEVMVVLNVYKTSMNNGVGIKSIIILGDKEGNILTEEEIYRFTIVNHQLYSSLGFKVVSQSINEETNEVENKKFNEFNPFDFVAETTSNEVIVEAQAVNMPVQEVPAPADDKNAKIQEEIAKLQAMLAEQNSGSESDIILPGVEF